MDIHKEFTNRFNKQERFLGADKKVNRSKPKVSIYAETYQQERYIAECLDFILMQKANFTFEIING